MRKKNDSGIKYIGKGIAIVYEDKYLLVIDKPEGLLTVATEREKDRTAHALITDYIRRGCGRSQKRIYVVHRLDRETSGLLIFAKSEEVKFRLQARWKENDKKYLTIVHGTCEKDSGTISSYLAEDSAYNVYSTPDSTKGKLAQTEYRVLKRAKNYSLLEVTLLTGRKNQIRVHFAGIGRPIVGDTKYGHENDSQPRMALHARALSFRHPFTGKTLSFTSEIPEFFTTLVGKIEQAGIVRSGTSEKASVSRKHEENLHPSPHRGRGRR